MMETEPQPTTATAYLVGAGPGDPGLVTVRAVELLKKADVVIYDALVNPDLLRHAHSEAEIIFAGKRADQHTLPQEELNALLVRKAREGKTVVRLKGGDPYIFGRGGEEAQDLAKANVPFEVIPGISSIVAAANYAGIPLTHRSHCSTFTVLTGHEDPTKPDTSIDWEGIARTPGTKVILMGSRRISTIAESLMREGLSPDTPAAMIQWGTTGRQKTVTATLSTLAEAAERSSMGAPLLTIIGSVVSLQPELNWFEKRPLFRRRIVVTRTRTQASQLSAELLGLGADVLEIPTIRTTAPHKTRPMDDALKGLHAYDWIVFTSPNGVQHFFEAFFRKFDDLRDFGGMKIAAVGPVTAAKIREQHLHIDAMPEQYLANKIVEAIEQQESIENLRILLMRAEVANAELPKWLEEKGAIVDDIACYRTVIEKEDRNGAARRFLEEGADWITFTSSSTVENFHKRFNLPKQMQNFSSLKMASIGPETSKTLDVLGVKPSVEASPHTISGLVQAILDWENKSSLQTR